MTVKNCCDYCDDGSGKCVFPYYGVAPHFHGKQVIGETSRLPKENWTNDFEEDPEAKGLGTFLRCPRCGRPDQPKDQQ